MRIIRIVTDGIPIEVIDDMKIPLEDATKELTDMLKNETVMMLIGKDSSAIIRPSSVSGINIIDRPDQTSGVEMQKFEENEEQNNDIICDIEE